MRGPARDIPTTPRGPRWSIADRYDYDPRGIRQPHHRVDPGTRTSSPNGYRMRHSQAGAQIQTRCSRSIAGTSRGVVEPRRGRRMGAQLRSPNQGQKMAVPRPSRRRDARGLFLRPIVPGTICGTLRPKNGEKSLVSLPSRRDAWGLKVATLKLLFRGVPSRSIPRGGTAGRLGHFESIARRRKWT